MQQTDAYHLAAIQLRRRQLMSAFRSSPYYLELPKEGNSDNFPLLLHSIAHTALLRSAKPSPPALKRELGNEDTAMIPSCHSNHYHMCPCRYRPLKKGLLLPCGFFSFHDHDFSNTSVALCKTLCMMELLLSRIVTLACSLAD